MEVVKINAIEVAEGQGPELERRFAHRAGAVDHAPGFLGFELLRPVDGRATYYVYTRWESDEAFSNWASSEAFEQGHAGDQARGPVGANSELISFEVVISTKGNAAG